LSLGAALNKTKSQISASAVKTQKPKRSNTVSEDDVFEAWIRFPSQIMEISSLHFLFSKQPLWNSEKLTITVEISGSLLASEFNEIAPKLTKFLRDRLQNDYIEIVTEVSDIKREDVDLSPKGKAQAMAKKNNQLRELCRKLYLDFV